MARAELAQHRHEAGQLDLVADPLLAPDDQRAAGERPVPLGLADAPLDQLQPRAAALVLAKAVAEVALQQQGLRQKVAPFRMLRRAQPFADQRLGLFGALIGHQRCGSLEGRRVVRRGVHPAPLAWRPARRRRPRPQRKRASRAFAPAPAAVPC
jgi:hypothetical protein